MLQTRAMLQWRANATDEIETMAWWNLVKDVDGDEVLRHLAVNTPYYFDPAQRGLLIELAGYLAGKLVSLRPEQASATRVLGELMRGQRL